MQHKFKEILPIIDEFVQQLQFSDIQLHELNETAIKAYNAYQKNPSFHLLVKFDIIYFLDQSNAIIEYKDVEAWEHYLLQLDTLKNVFKNQTLFDHAKMVKKLILRIEQKMQKTKGYYLEWPEKQLTALINHKVAPIKS